MWHQFRWLSVLSSIHNQLKWHPCLRLMGLGSIQKAIKYLLVLTTHFVFIFEGGKAMTPSWILSHTSDNWWPLPAGKSDQCSCQEQYSFRCELIAQRTEGSLNNDFPMMNHSVERPDAISIFLPLLKRPVADHCKKNNVPVSPVNVSWRHVSVQAETLHFINPNNNGRLTTSLTLREPCVTVCNITGWYIQLTGKYIFPDVLWGSGMGNVRMFLSHQASSVD